MEKKLLRPLPFLHKTQIMKYYITDHRVHIVLKFNKKTDINQLVIDLSDAFKCTNSHTILSEESNILVFFGY